MAAGKYHVSPNGPRLCKATVKGCPYGSDDAHFSTQAEAQAAYEQKMAEAFGTLETVKRTKKEGLRQTGYQMRDTALDTAYMVKAALPVEEARKAIAQVRAQKDYYETQAIVLASSTSLRLSASIGNGYARLARWEAKRQIRKSERATERARELRAIAESADARANSLSARAQEIPRGSIIPGDPDTIVDRVSTDENNVVQLHTVTRNGVLSRRLTVSADEPITYRRAPGKRALRGQQPRRRREMKTSPFFQRVQEASGMVGEAFNVLRGVDNAPTHARATASRSYRGKRRAERPLSAKWKSKVASVGDQYRGRQQALTAVKADRDARRQRQREINARNFGLRDVG